MSESELRRPNKIHLLPEHIIDQIKAGEVIERPANVLKEALENSLDAGATEIKIHIKNNGLDLINIEDNGSGISFEDLPYAFCRHATSKITRFEDLYSLNSFGFRGEALASISSISRVQCHTSTGDSSSIFQVEGAQIKAHEESSAKYKGTKLFIKDLFFNTPVRMKFLQSNNAEKNRLKKVIEAFLITKPNIEFHIKWDDDDKKVFPPQSLLSRFREILAQKKGTESEVLHVQEEFNQMQINAYISLDTTKSNAKRKQLIFINQRNILDKQIQGVISRVMDPFWQGASGSYCVFLDFPADQIDANIHPNKTVVKIHQYSQALSFIGSSIKNAIKKISKQTTPTHEQMTRQDFSSQENLTSIEEHNFYVKDLSQRSGNNENADLPLFASTHSRLTKINSSFWLIDQKYLISIQKLIYQLMFNEINPDTSALLISKPIKMKCANKLILSEIAQSTGIELDQLDHDTLALRGVPSHMPFFDFWRALQKFSELHQTPIKNKEDLEKVFNELKLEEFISNHNKLKEIIESKPIVEMLQMGHCIELNNSKLKKLFK